MSSKYEEEPDIESDIDSDGDDDIIKPSKKISTKSVKLATAYDDGGEESDDDSDADSLKSSENGSQAEDDEDLDEEERDRRAETKSALPLFPEFEDSDEEEEEDENDEHYLQKFDESTKQNIVSDFHPEMQAHNYDEVDILATIVRNSDGLIIDPLHRTLPFVTKYEKARVLGERAKQLNSGAKAFVEVEPTVIDGYLIALKEYEQKKIPFILKRPLPNGGCEYWRMRDLEI